MSLPILTLLNRTKMTGISLSREPLSGGTTSADFYGPLEIIPESQMRRKVSQNGSFAPTSGNSTRNMTLIDDDFYEYDLNLSLETFFWDQLIPPLVVYTISLLVGLLGNSLIIYTVFRYRRMKTTTNVFLASLASADLLLLLICIPVKTAKVFSFSWTFGWFLCKSVHYLQNVSVFCSVLTLTAISLERHYAIVFPFRSQYLLTVRQAQKVTALVWVSSFILATPILIVQIHSNVGIQVEAFWCHRDWDHPYKWRVYEMYMLILVLILPTLIMSFAYSSLVFQLSNVLGERNEFVLSAQLKVEGHPLNGMRFCPKRTSDQEMRQVLRMLISVVLLFVLSWGPLLITNVLVAWGYLPPYDPDPFYKHLFNALHLIAYSNSCINPLVYGFLSKNFRQSFQAALCPCLKGSDPPTRQLSLSRSRHTSVREGGCLGVRTSRATYV